MKMLLTVIALTLLDAEFGKSELLCVVSPIRIISTGGYVAVTHFHNRATTCDVDYLLDPDIEDNEDIKEDMRRAGEVVADKMNCDKDWFNNELSIFTSRPKRPALFNESILQNVILFKGKRLVIYAGKWTWALEQKVRRIGNSSRQAKNQTDIIDVVAILRVITVEIASPLSGKYVKALNTNGFDVPPTEETLKLIAETYRKTYGEEGLSI